MVNRFGAINEPANPGIHFAQAFRQHTGDVGTDTKRRSGVFGGQLQKVFPRIRADAHVGSGTNRGRMRADRTNDISPKTSPA